MPLTDDLIGHWKLEEASGARVDSHGTNDLTDTNTVTQAAGKLGNAGQFTKANSEYLTHVDNPDLSTGNIDFTIACWVYADSGGSANHYIVAKGNEWNLAWNWIVNRFYFSTRSFTFSVAADALGVPATGTWYFIVVWQDATAQTINIQVNNGSVDSVSQSGFGPIDDALAFVIGGLSDGTLTWDGRIDSTSFWKRVLTTQERTDLYNGGAGLDYPFELVPTNDGKIIFRNANAA